MKSPCVPRSSGAGALDDGLARALELAPRATLLAERVADLVARELLRSLDPFSVKLLDFRAKVREKSLRSAQLRRGRTG